MHILRHLDPRRRGIQYDLTTSLDAVSLQRLRIQHNELPRETKAHEQVSGVVHPHCFEPPEEEVTAMYVLLWFSLYHYLCKYVSCWYVYLPRSFRISFSYQLGKVWCVRIKQHNFIECSLRAPCKASQQTPRAWWYRGCFANRLMQGSCKGIWWSWFRNITSPSCC